MSLDAGSGRSGFDVGRSRLGDAFYPLYQLLFGENSGFVVEFDRKLKQSQLATPVELYLSRALAIGVLAGLLLWGLGTGLGYWLFALGIIDTGPLLGARIPHEGLLELVIALRVPFLVVVTGVVFGSLGFAIGFGSLVLLPYSRASSRQREINLLLSDAVSFMYALSVGGLNQLEIIESIARAEDTYGEISREFQSILYETEYFDTDYRTAIRNQAMLTPSEELSQFLTDMLSIINSGGDLESFLDDKKEKHMRTAQHEQEQTLESLELFGEMYMTLSLFPLLLIVVLVVMLMMGEVDMLVMYITVYALIPMIGAAFLILVATVKKDEPGNGYLNPPEGIGKDDRKQGVFDLGLVDRFAESSDFQLFARIRLQEMVRSVGGFLRRPHRFFLTYPMYTLVVSVPLAIAVLGLAIVTGMVPTSWPQLIDQPVWGTFVWLYLPLYLLLIPLGVFVEWDRRRRYGITDNLSEELRKLSSANDTGMTLLDSFRTVADTSTGKLSAEFHEIHSKVSYGMTLREALIRFNNKYHIPRLARTVKLVAKAQEASSEITDVLTTAAKTSENHDEIERERRARTRMQITIIIMTFLTMLAVIAILKVQFLDVMAALSSEADTGGGAGVGGGMGMGGSIDADALNVLFFHAVTLHAVMSGFIAGYMRDADLRSGIKYAVALMSVSLVVWMAIG